MKYQNRQIKNGRFNPVEYFGGWTPKQVEKGIVRHIVKQMFDIKSSQPSIQHNRSNIDFVKSEQVKAQFDIINHKSLSKSKIPSYTELSQCFNQTQKKI